MGAAGSVTHAILIQLSHYRAQWLPGRKRTLPKRDLHLQCRFVYGRSQ